MSACVDMMLTYRAIASRVWMVKGFGVEAGRRDGRPCIPRLGAEVEEVARAGCVAGEFAAHAHNSDGGERLVGREVAHDE